MNRIGALTAVWLACVGTSRAAAQEAQAPLRVFLDCQQMYCDMDFYRTEIAFVDHVRTRQDADVHILVTRQQTGGGGGEYTAAFIGLRQFAGRRDTLRYYSRHDDPDDVTRRGLARLFTIGLLRYVAGTPVADRIAITYTAPPADQTLSASKQHDPWKYWVFYARASGYFQGESSSPSLNVSGGLSANRTTE